VISQMEILPSLCELLFEAKSTLLPYSNLV
ncbi:MAG: hypothetical protein ACI81W_001095, partial [Saprospiraceae bacterium]